MYFCKAMRMSPRPRAIFRSVSLGFVMAAAAARFAVRMEFRRLCLAPSLAPIGLGADACCFYV